MNLSRSLYVVLACALTAACSQPSAPADGLPTAGGTPAATASAAATPAAPAAATPGVSTTEQATLTVNPGQIFACDGRDRVVAKVSWSVKDPAVTTVKVLAGDKGGSKKNLFTAGGNAGEASTDNWVVEGTTFYLVTGDDQRPLASYEVTSLPCK